MTRREKGSREALKTQHIKLNLTYIQSSQLIQNYYRQREKPHLRLGAGAKRLGKVTSEGWSVAGVPAGLSEARGTKKNSYMIKHSTTNKLHFITFNLHSIHATNSILS